MIHLVFFFIESGLCCRFVPAKLDEMFTKHAKTVPNALTKDELDEMLKDNREKMDVAGW
jgi:peroxygenase